MELNSDSLTIINQDQSFETVQTVIGSILEMIDDYQWTIGGILVFLRFRAAHIPLEKFTRPADGGWPAEFLAYLKEKTGYRPEQCNNIDELLHWNRLTFEAYVVLYDSKEITVWEKTNDPFTDYQYQAYLDMLTKNLASKLNGKTMWAYYTTAKVFPVSARASDRTWTFHYDTYQYHQLKHSVDDINSIDGADLIQTPVMQLEDFIVHDFKQTRQIRELMRLERENQRGYKWLLELPYELKLSDGDNEKVVIVFDRDVKNSYRWIFFSGAGLVSYYYNNSSKKIYLKGEKLYVGKVYVGHLPLMDQDEDVDKAIIQLSGKMKWVISGPE